MKAIFKRAEPYKHDVLNLPVADVDAAIPYYEKKFGFHVVSRQDTPNKSVILARDNIQIGLAENGGDPTQEGAFIEVDSIQAAHEEIKGTAPAKGALEVQYFDKAPYRVFFDIAPDGLCYMIGEHQE